MSNNDIRNYLPHRYPFLLIDKILDFKKHDSLRAQKNVSNNEPCFQGHFPDYPVFPGVLILEAMAQANTNTKMLTGDYRETAIYVAHEAGIIDKDEVESDEG